MRQQPPTPAWLDEQFNNRARVPDHEAIFQSWREASELVRSQASRRLDLRYGPGPRQTLDLFPAACQDAPVFVFLHGGYWRSFDKSDHAFLAASFVADGAMVVLPNYDLCPDVGMEQIPLELVQALGWVVDNVALYGGNPTRIVLAGHSAGGHLATMLLSCDWRAAGLPRVDPRSALSISGLYDLSTIARAPYLQSSLKLTPEAVARLSPAGFPAPTGRRLFAVVGAQESEEFRRQNRLIREAWGPAAVPVCEELAGADHFSVLRQLADPKSRLHRLALELLGLNG